MNMLKKLLVVLVVVAISNQVAAQTAFPPEKYRRSFDQKFRIGTTLNVLWTSVEGKSLPTQYFTKPSVGIFLVAEYYFKPVIGISVGAGFQQLGAGIVTIVKQPVATPSLDSTYRTRLRFNTFAFPISLHLRTPKDVIVKGWRLGGAVSLIPVINTASNQVYNSLEPSLYNLDNTKNVSSLYFKNDLLYQIAIGPEIEAGTGILKFQFVYTVGTTNVYSSNQGNGTNQAYGFRVGYLF